MRDSSAGIRDAQCYKEALTGWWLRIRWPAGSCQSAAGGGWRDSAPGL